MAAIVASKSTVRRWGAGTASIARLLIAAEVPLTGVAIANAVGVSQPRASQVLKRLAEHNAVRATEQGYAGRPARLLDLYRHRARPLLAQPETYWYSTRPAAEQAHSLVDLGLDRGARIVFSADLAPDLLVPWRHPTLTVVYSDQPLMPENAGLVPAEGRADASIIVRSTNDQTLLSPAPPWPSLVDGIPLTDPTQQWWDLLDLGSEDRKEAANRLRKAILNRTIPLT